MMDWECCEKSKAGIVILYAATALTVFYERRTESRPTMTEVGPSESELESRFKRGSKDWGGITETNLVQGKKEK